MSKTNIISQIFVIAFILLISFIGGSLVSPLLNILGIMMALTSGFITVHEYLIFKTGQKEEMEETNSELANTESYAA